MLRKAIVITYPELWNNLSNIKINGNIVGVVLLDKRFFDDEQIIDIADFDSINEEISKKIDALIPGDLTDLTVVITAQARPPSIVKERYTYDQWNPILVYPKERRRPLSRSILFTWLLLEYPEVNWIFLPEDIPASNKPNYYNFLEEPFKRIYEDKFISLFDPSGIRNNIKKSVLEDGDTEKSYRNALTIAVDEEESYAYLHSYIAYKSGYLALPVLTMSELDRMNSLYRDSDDIALSFEDIFLNFHDRETIKPETYAGQHLSNLEQRDECLPSLKRIKKRIFVTVGHHQIKWYKNNQAYIKKLKTEGHKIKILYKPSGGIFNVLERSGLINEFWKYKQKCLKKSVQIASEDQGKRHSAPGRLLLIAQKLISRAEKIFNEASSAKECIHGAMLALEAQELLGYKTPTTCLEAIALKHKLEVKAECMFYGVGYNIDMKNRFKEIEGEIKAVSQWFHPSVRKKSLLNGQLGILTEIVEILREYGQFDEEIQCLKRIRKLNRRFYFHNHPLLRIVQPLRAYIETLVSSFPLFIGALFFWPVFYGLLSWVSGAQYETSSNTAKAVGWYVANAFYSFFGLQPSFGPSSTSAHVISLLIVITGFLHLGIFISYLYSLIFRK